MTHFDAPPPHREPTPKPFQFRLRTLFAGTACLSALFALMNVLGPMWSTILLWFLGLASLHVIANAWGSKGWRRSGELNEEPHAGHDDRGARGLGSLRAHSSAPATRLRETTDLTWTMFAATSAGALLTGGFGAGCLACLGSENVGYVAIAVGGVSAAVVGGFFGFLASSFIEVAGQAWREAVHGRPAVAALEAGEDGHG